MKQLASIPLRWWLPAVVAAAFGLVFVASGLDHRRRESARVETGARELLRSLLSGEARAIERLLRAPDPGLLAEQIAQLGAMPSVGVVALVDDRGQVLQANARTALGRPMRDVLPMFHRARLELAQRERRLVLDLDAERRRLLAYQPVVLGAKAGERRPYALGGLLLAYDLSAAEGDARREAATTILLEAAFTLLILAGLLLLLRFRLVRPLDYLKEQVGRISRGDLSTEVVVSGRDEVAELAAAIRLMEGDLRAAVEERTRHVDEMRASDQRFRNLVDSTDGIVWEADASTFNFQYVSGNAERILGYPTSDWLQPGFWADHIHPDDRADTVARSVARAARGEAHALEYRFVAHDGRTVWLRDLVTVVAEDGQPRWLRGLMVDVTGLKQTQETLAGAMARLERTGTLAKVGGWELDLRTMQLHWSLETSRIHETDPAASPTLYEAINFYAPDARPVIQAAVQAGIDRGEPWDLALPMTTATGRSIWVRTQGFAVMEEGRAVKLLGAFHDITDRRQLDATLRLESAALAAAANAILITDRRGVIEWANAAFTTISGYSLAESVGRKPGELLKSGHHPPAYYANLWNTILRGEAWFGEMTNRRKDGTLYTEEMTITPLQNDGGEITHFIAVKQDISQRKLLEEQLRQSQKMESVGHLAGGVAHDFNNMLTVILGRAELALRQTSPKERVHGHLEEIQEAARRSADLTRQLLAFARRQTIAPQPLDLNASVEASLGILRRLIGENVELVWRPAEQLWTVLMDSAQLDQILTNLCVNARDAIADVGTLVIATANRELDAAFCANHPEAEPGDYVELTVSDSGHGMDSATLARVFDPFFTTKGVGEGTGLGLSMVYGAVRQNQGAITASSEPGRGTTFSIFLPRHTGTEVQPAPPANAHTRGGNETILVVEDEPAVLKLTVRMLETQGYVVLGTSSPREAISLLMEHQVEVDLVLTDVVMPEMNGRDLVRILREMVPRLRHVFMSGYAADVLGDRISLDQEKLIIEKPFDLASLTTTVRAALDRGPGGG